MASLSRHGGFLALAAFLAVAALTFERWSGQAAVAPNGSVPQAVTRPDPDAVRYTAVDGDSLRNGAGDVRLSGIDAPELSQTCRDASGRSWPCGRAARERLRALVSRGAHCTPEGRDRYGRQLARCAAGGADIGETMVREGLALDFMGGGYGAAERDARQAKRGIWAGEFDLPQEHRRRSGPRAER